MSKIYVLYHASCADGFGAAFAAWLKFGDTAEYLAVQYGKPVPEVESGSEVYIVDFSYPRDVLVALWGRLKCLVVLDHHATAQTALEGIVCKEPSLIRFDMAKSGAVMAWEYFHPEVPVPEFFLYLQDRDLWQWKLPASREVSDAIRSYPFDFKVWQNISSVELRDGKLKWGQKVISASIATLQEEGRGIRRMTRQVVEQAARNASWSLIDITPPISMNNGPHIHKYINHDGGKDSDTQFMVPTLNCTAFISETCEEMLRLHPQAKFVASYFDSKDGKRVWSLRSRPDFDCSVIAKAFGGGGHKQACGFTQ